MMGRRTDGALRGVSSLRGRLLVTQVAIVLPLIVVAAIGGLMMHNDAARYDRSLHGTAAAAEITSLQTALNGVQASLTSKPVLGGDSGAFAQAMTGVAVVTAGIERLSVLLPEQQASVALVGQVWARMTQVLQSYGSSVGLARTILTDARPYVAAASAINAALTGVMQALSVVASTNAATLRHELAIAHRRQRSLDYALALLAVAGLVVALVTARRLHRTISGPLQALREGARRIGDDEPAAPVPAGRIKEFAEVATAFNTMADRLARGHTLLADQERWFRSLVRASSDVVIVTDRHGVVRFVTPSVERILGYPADELAGRDAVELLHPADAEHVRVRLAAAAGRDGPGDLFACRIRHHDQDWRQVEIAINNQLADPAIDGLVLTVRDVTEARLLQDQLSHQAFHDDLTGLPNRALFADRLSHTLSRRSEIDDVAVILLDLDDFKTVNDTLGHGAGDRLIVEITARLRGLLRESTTVARLGGDEFAVLLDEVTEPGEAEAVAERLLAAIRRPVRLGEIEVFPRASAGVAIGRPGTWAAEELLRRADTAMYQAKGQGKDSVVTYSEELANPALRRLGLSADLRHAIDRDELEVQYQPTVRLDNGAVSGMEALVRWHHPEHGTISPVEFIPIAEESGTIIDIGRWVLDQACRQAARWQHELGRRYTVSVNVSGRQLQHPSLLDDVMAALRDSGLPAGHLILEITESVVLQETTELLQRLHALKALGIRLAIDDFGTGYSSLSYLQRLPVDILKIDRSFITGLDDADGLALVTTILRLAKDLRMDTVAEGAETPAQIQLLRALGCAVVQGFHYARPTTAGELPATLARIEQVTADEAGRSASATTVAGGPAHWS